MITLKGFYCNNIYHDHIKATNYYEFQYFLPTFDGIYWISLYIFFRSNKRINDFTGWQLLRVPIEEVCHIESAMAISRMQNKE